VRATSRFYRYRSLDHSPGVKGVSHSTLSRDFTEVFATVIAQTAPSLAADCQLQGDAVRAFFQGLGAKLRGATAYRPRHDVLVAGAE